MLLNKNFKAMRVYEKDLDKSNKNLCTSYKTENLTSLKLNSVIVYFIVIDTNSGRVKLLSKRVI